MSTTEEEGLVLDQSGQKGVTPEELEEQTGVVKEAREPEITQSVFDLAWQRRSQEDLKIVLDTLAEHGTITIVPDPEVPPEPEVPEGSGEAPNQELPA